MSDLVPLIREKLPFRDTARVMLRCLFLDKQPLKPFHSGPIFSETWTQIKRNDLLFTDQLEVIVN